MISRYKSFCGITVLSTLALLNGCSSMGGAGPAAAPVPAPVGPNPQVLLMGEVHDNVQGHRLRVDLLRQRVEAGWRPAIVMEQFDRENQDLLDKAQKGCLDAQCVIQVVNGPRWDWQLYYPVIQLALTYHLPLVAGNLSRSDASRVVRDGIQATFDPQSIKDYHLDQPLPEALRAAQQQEIAAGHCGMLPEMMFKGMVDAQVSRDIWMAKIIREQQPRDVVLIAGNGHVRKDIGVARWINQVAPILTVRAEGFVEEGKRSGKDNDPRFDQTYTLAPQQRPDPCAKFKAK